MAVIKGSNLGARRAIEDKAFAGKRVLGPHAVITVTTGAPTHVVAHVGVLNWDVTNSDAYICTVAGAGTWVKINA